MPLPSLVQLANTFGQWVTATNNLISHVDNTSVYILVSQNATPRISVGNAAVNGTMTITTANVTGLMGVAGNATFNQMVTVNQDLVVTGNLTISGTTTFINTTNLQIGDNIVTLNADLPGATPPTENAGIDINRGTLANVSFRWNETSDVWEMTTDGTNYGTVIGSISTTGINASALSTGTIPDARVSGAYTNVTSLTIGSTGINTTAISTITANVSGNTQIDGLLALKEATELTVINTSALTGVLTFNALNSGVMYFSMNASANWTVNAIGNSTVTLSTILPVGRTLSITVIATQNTTPRYPTAFAIDGTTTTVNWLSGIAPSAGNSNAKDVYTYNITKTAATPTYLVLGTASSFA